MNNVDDRLRRAAAETRRLAEHRRPAELPIGQPGRSRGPLVLAAAFVIVIGLFGVLPLLLDTTEGESPLGSAPPVTEPGGPSTTMAPSTSPTDGGTDCSSAGIPAPVADSTLPGAVAATREALIGAAMACDFDALTAIAGDSFTTNFGVGGAEALQQAEDEGNGLLGTLLALFDMSYGVIDEGNGGEIYVWPSAHSYDSWDEIPAEAIAELETIHTAEEIETMRQADSYLGWRTGIDDDGQWLYITAGD